MTAFQLSNRLAHSCLTVRTVAEMEPGHLQFIGDAIVSGAGQYFDNTPQRFKERTWKGRFNVPLDGTVSVTNGSATVTGMSFRNGATLKIEGEFFTVSQTQAGTWALDDVWEGTTGSKTATLDRDVDSFSWLFDGFAGPVMISKSGDPGELEITEYAAADRADEIGYAIEATETGTLIRLLPKLTAAYNVRVRVAVKGLTPPTLAQLKADGYTLPVEEDHAIRFLLPLCAEKLTGHPLFRPERVQDVIARAETALQQLSLVRPTVSNANNRIIPAR